MVRIFRGRRRVSAALFLMLSGCGDSPALAGIDVTCPYGPVILVHGLDQGSSTFEDLIASLQRRGMPIECLRAIDYSAGNLPIREAAERELAPFIDRILDDLGGRSSGVADAASIPGKVNLIGHSMGALSSRWYAARVRPDRVRTWISTSGANHGTNWECPQQDTTGHGDMCPAFARNPRESAVQIALNGMPGPDVDETPYGLGPDSAGVQTVAADRERSILYLTIQVAGDEYIMPANSMLLDGAGGVPLALDERGPWREVQPGNFRFAGSSTHDGILGTEALADFIYRAITAVRREPAATTTPATDTQ